MQPEIQIYAGNKYIFDVSDSSMDTHQFRLSTTSDGVHGGGSQYTSASWTESGTSGTAGATATASALNARRLVIISDVPGVLDKNNNLISEINSNKVKEMIKIGEISGGMIPKLNNAINIAHKVKGTVIIDGRVIHSILYELLSDKGSGTLIRK